MLPILNTNPNYRHIWSKVSSISLQHRVVQNDVDWLWYVYVSCHDYVMLILYVVTMLYDWFYICNHSWSSHTQWRFYDDFVTYLMKRIILAYIALMYMSLWDLKEMIIWKKWLSCSKLCHADLPKEVRICYESINYIDIKSWQLRTLQTSLDHWLRAQACTPRGSQ